MEEQNPESLEAKLKAVDDKLDKMEEQLGLPKLEDMNYTNLVEKAMKHNFQTKLTAEQYGEYAAILSRHSCYLQRVVNKENAKIVYMEARIIKIITPRLNQQKSTFHPEKKMLAIAEDIIARELQDTITICKVKVERLNYISMLVENMAQKYLELQKTLRVRRFDNV